MIFHEEAGILENTGLLLLLFSIGIVVCYLELEQSWYILDQDLLDVEIIELHYYFVKQLKFHLRTA